MDTEHLSAVRLYSGISCPCSSTSANGLPIASFINTKSPVNVHCPCESCILVWCLVSCSGAGTTLILSGSWGLNYFGLLVLPRRKVIRWHGLVPLPFLLLFLSLDRLKRDVSKFTVSFLCLLEAKMKLLVTWKKHSDLLLYYILTLFFFFP